MQQTPSRGAPAGYIHRAASLGRGDQSSRCYALSDVWRAAGRSFALVDENGQIVQATPTWPSEAARGGFRNSGPILGENLLAICPHWARAKVTAEWPTLVTHDSAVCVLYPVDRPVDQERWFILLIDKDASAGDASIRFMVILVSVLRVLEDSALMVEFERNAGISRERILVDILRHGLVNLHLDS